MEPLNHQMMGYDRAVSMFSPDGRLLQVEYAKKTVKQGSTAIGIACKDGIVLLAEKKFGSSLIIPESVEKIYEIDNHIAATFAGITSDARILIERARVKAQQNQITFESNVDTVSIVKDISDLKQYTTQSGGLRPFGAALIIAGVDLDCPKIFVTDPTGIFFQYKAVAIGEHDSKIDEILQKEYTDKITTEGAIKLAIKALKSVSESKIDESKIDCGVIKINNPKYNKLSQNEIKKYLN